MPTYEYECEKCGKIFDYFQSFSEEPKKTCEECGGKLRKLMSAGTGLIFKGNGFYITDYKNKSASTPPPDTSTTENKTTTPAKKESPKSSKNDTSEK